MHIIINLPMFYYYKLRNIFNVKVVHKYKNTKNCNFFMKIIDTLDNLQYV